MVRGQYGCIYSKGKRVGGFLYWDKQEKLPNPGYWTSFWWLFEEFKQGEIELYEVIKNRLQIVQNREKVILNCSHKLRFGCVMKGSVKFEIIK